MERKAAKRAVKVQRDLGWKARAKCDSRGGWYVECRRDGEMKVLR